MGSTTQQPKIEPTTTITLESRRKPSIGDFQRHVRAVREAERSVIERAKSISFGSRPSTSNGSTGESGHVVVHVTRETVSDDDLPSSSVSTPRTSSESTSVLPGSFSIPIKVTHNPVPVQISLPPLYPTSDTPVRRKSTDTCITASPPSSPKRSKSISAGSKPSPSGVRPPRLDLEFNDARFDEIFGGASRKISQERKAQEKKSDGEESMPSSPITPFESIALDDNAKFKEMRKEQYGSDEEPRTLARALFIWGFLFPVFWILGAIIIFLSLNHVSDIDPYIASSSSHPAFDDVLDMERGTALGEKIKQDRLERLQTAELRWAWYSLYAIVAFTLTIGVSVVIWLSVAGKWKGF